MKKLNLKEILVPTVSLFLICLVVALLLGLTNELTKAPIAQQEKNTAEAAMLSVCPEAESFEAVEGLEAEVNRGIGSAGDTVGYAIATTEKGYGGDVKIMVGFGLQGEVTGVEILSQSETPGLGANCTRSDFTDMYKQPIPEGGFALSKDGGNVDALTGATITSRAVTNAVNRAAEIYATLQGGEG